MRGGFKKSKPIPALPHDARLKSHPIAAPPPLQGGENNRKAKQGGTNQEGQGGREREREREREEKNTFFFLSKTYTRMINWWLLHNIELRQILLLHWILIFIFSQFIMSSIFKHKIGCCNI